MGTYNQNKKRTSKQGSQQCIVTISCDSGWTGIPDVRFDEAGTLGDDGGGGDDEDGISFLQLFADSKVALEKDDDHRVLKSFLYKFHLKNGDHSLAEWRAVLQDGQLYVEVPEGELPVGSKECFVSLLEYAEENLSCEHVFVGLLKDRADRETLMRTFMFLGFETVRPNHKMCPVNSGYIFMAYTVEQQLCV